MSAHSDFPTHWCESHIEDLFWTAEEKAQHQCHEFGNAEFHQRLRAWYVEKIPGMQALLMEETEAQLHYNANKHTKKSDPRGRYYPARERLYRARRAVEEALDQHFSKHFVSLKEQFQLQVWKENQAKKPPSPEELAAARSQNPETFPDWLREEIQLYTDFVAEPWRQQSCFLPGALSLQVGQERLHFLRTLQELQRTQGVGAAYLHYLEKDEIGMTGPMKLAAQFESEIVVLDRPTLSGKDGYEVAWPHSKRPVLLDPIRDAELIARQKTDYLSRPQQRQMTLADWIDSRQPTTAEPPKRKPGRPKGAKNKPKPRPINEDVAAWQAEADKKYPHLKAS